MNGDINGDKQLNILKVRKFSFSSIAPGVCEVLAGGNPQKQWDPHTETNVIRSSVYGSKS
jgi:hypothetical protein